MRQREAGRPISSVAGAVTVEISEAMNSLMIMPV
jgi:hypothetical protein